MTRALAEPTVFTTAMLAERWACSERHIRNMIDRGEIKAWRIGGRLIRIPIAYVEEYECHLGESPSSEDSSPSPSTKEENVDDTRSQLLMRAKLNVLRLPSTRS